MYKLKTVCKGVGSNVYECKTLKEVADQMRTACGAESLEEVLKVQKEWNIRFYLTYKKD